MKNFKTLALSLALLYLGTAKINAQVIIHGASEATTFYQIGQNETFDRILSNEFWVNTSGFSVALPKTLTQQTPPNAWNDEPFEAKPMACFDAKTRYSMQYVKCGPAYYTVVDGRKTLNCQNLNAWACMYDGPTSGGGHVIIDFN